MLETGCLIYAHVNNTASPKYMTAMSTSDLIML